MQLNVLNRKGQFGGIQAGFLALMFMAVAIVVVVSTNGFGADFTAGQQEDFCSATFDDGQCYDCPDEYTYNATAGGVCYNTTNTSQTTTALNSESISWNITSNGLGSLNTLAQGTDDVTDVSIITIVLGLLVALIGVFGWIGYKRYS